MTTRTDRLQVIFEVGGDGKLKATLTDIGKEGAKAADGLDKASASQDRMLRAAKIAGTVLGTGIVAGLGLVIKNTMEAERVDAQLEARLKSTAGVAGMSKAALDDLAAATARKTTYDDEAIKSSETMLLTFTKVYADVFPRAIDVITDMATAMGTDLQTATIQVGKALNDPIQGVSALTRAGVQFSEAQKEVIKDLVETGRESEAQAVILRELETQFGGAAEAARGTLGGALVALKNTLMDLTEGSGGSLAGTTGAVNELIDTLNDPAVKSGADNVVSSLFAIADAAIVVTAKFGDLLGAYNGWLSRQGFKPADDDLAGLMTRRDKLLAGQRAKAGNGLAGANDPLGKLIGIDKTVQSEIDSVEARIAAAIKNSGVTMQDMFPVPGTRMPTPLKQGFNFATDTTYRVSGPTAPAKPVSPTGGGSGGGGRASRPATSRAMPDFYRQTVDDIQREIEAAARLDDEWNELAATLAGPLAQAEFRHKENLREIEELGRKTGQSAAEIDTLKRQETEAYEKQRAEIERSLDPMGQLLESYRAEIDLMGMGNAERAMANTLRREGISLMSEEGQLRMSQAREVDGAARAAQDALGYADDMKSVTKSFLMDMSKDAAGTFRNIGDYWEDLVDRMLSRWLDAGLDGLFSGQGFSGFSGGFGGGGGSGGGFWGMLGGLFSGGGSSGFAASANGVSGADFASIFESGAFGLAQGGSARKGQLYEVAEFNRPEVFKANGRTWLIPGSNGYVQPMGDGVSGSMGGGGDVHHATYNFDFRGTDHHRASTPDQISQRIDERVRRTGRNR